MATVYAQNVKIKKILEDIISNAFKESNKLTQYKGFYLMITDKNITSYAGVYHTQGRVIEIVGLDRDSKHIVVTCLHELSHHIDYCNRHITDHSKEFYEIYEKLLHTSLNMRIISPADITMRDVTDSNKVKKMLDNWRPSFIDYKTDKFIISVANCFEVKEILKNRGYKYNSLNKNWQIELNKENIEIEKEWLINLNVDESNINISNSADIQIDAKLKILISGKNTYNYKEYLKSEGFVYNNKQWIKYLKAEDDIQSFIEEYKKQMPDCKIQYKL